MSGPSKTVRRLVLDRDAGSCAWCGQHCETRTYSLQHRRARGMGGTSRPESNLPAVLVTLCGSATTGCHGRCEAAPELARHYGYRLYQNEDPTEVPVWTARLGWVLLDNFGGYVEVPDPNPAKTLMLERVSLAILEAQT